MSRQLLGRLLKIGSRQLGPIWRFSLDCLLLYLSFRFGNGHQSRKTKNAHVSKTTVLFSFCLLLISGSTHFSDNPFLRQFVLPTKLSSLPALPFSSTSYLRLVFFPFLRHFDTSDNPFLRQFSYGHNSDKWAVGGIPTPLIIQY